MNLLTIHYFSFCTNKGIKIYFDRKLIENSKVSNNKSKNIYSYIFAESTRNFEPKTNSSFLLPTFDSNLLLYQTGSTKLAREW